MRENKSVELRQGIIGAICELDNKGAKAIVKLWWGGCDKHNTGVGVRLSRQWRSSE